jgi:hypothetical protein
MKAKETYTHNTENGPMNLWNILVAKFKKSKMHTARTEQKDISQSSELTASYISQKYLNYN